MQLTASTTSLHDYPFEIRGLFRLRLQKIPIPSGLATPTQANRVLCNQVVFCTHFTWVLVKAWCVKGSFNTVLWSTLAAFPPQVHVFQWDWTGVKEGRVFLSLWTYACIISSQQYYLLLLSGSHCLGFFIIIWRVDEVLLSCLWLEKELLHWYFQSSLACKKGIQSLLNLHLTHQKRNRKMPAGTLSCKHPILSFLAVETCTTYRKDLIFIRCPTGLNKWTRVEYVCYSLQTWLVFLYNRCVVKAQWILRSLQVCYELIYSWNALFLWQLYWFARGLNTYRHGRNSTVQNKLHAPTWMAWCL